MPRPADTKQRITTTARELFLRRGVQRTSLKEIADALGITKPALYYHFSSREDLVRAIVGPLVDRTEAFLLAHEALGGVEPRALLERYFDFRHEHREDLPLMLAETGYLTGAVQIAGTGELTQLPFFISACDFTLLGEELFAIVKKDFLFLPPSARGTSGMESCHDPLSKIGLCRAERQRPGSLGEVL